jgi:hypothetical protein
MMGELHARALCAAMAAGSLALLSSGVARAAELGFSYAATGVGYCTGSPCPANVIYTAQASPFGYNFNAHASSSDPMWGVATASAGPGPDPLELPQLQSSISASASHSPVGFPWDYSFANGSRRFEWMGASTDIAVSDFVGVLNFSNSGGPFSTSGFGEFSASLAILTSAVGHNALGDTWFADDGAGGFKADCNTAGAIGVGETHVVTTVGSGTLNLTASCPGVATFHLNTGDTFGIWSRVFSFRENGGTTNLSLSIALSPTLSSDTRSLLLANLQPLGAEAPEPQTWALMILGLGATGAALRSRRRKVEAHV